MAVRQLQPAQTFFVKKVHFTPPKKRSPLNQTPAEITTNKNFKQIWLYIVTYFTYLIQNVSSCNLAGLWGIMGAKLLSLPFFKISNTSVQ